MIFSPLRRSGHGWRSRFLTGRREDWRISHNCAEQSWTKEVSFTNFEIDLLKGIIWYLQQGPFSFGILVTARAKSYWLAVSHDHRGCSQLNTTCKTGNGSYNCAYVLRLPPVLSDTGFRR